MSGKMRVNLRQVMILSIIFTFLVQFVPVHAMAAAGSSEQDETERPEYFRNEAISRGVSLTYFD